MEQKIFMTEVNPEIKDTVEKLMKHGEVIFREFIEKWKSIVKKEKRRKFSK